MVRRLFFHMGAHKTATTLVQIRLRARRAALSGAGISYVDPRRLHRSALEDYVSGSSGDLHKATADFDDMVARPEGCRRAIIVFEDVLGKIELACPYSQASARLGRLLAVLDGSEGDWRLEPMFVIRRYDSFWLSCYRHNVKNGHIVEFHKALESLKRYSLDWRSVVLAIESAVGHEIPVRRYEDLAELDEAALLKTILRAGGIDMREVLKQPLRERLGRALRGIADIAQREISNHPNASLSDRGLILAEVIRPLVTPQEWRQVFRPLLEKHFNRMLEPESSFFEIPLELRQEMATRYQRDGEWLAGRLERVYPTS